MKNQRRASAQQLQELLDEESKELLDELGWDVKRLARATGYYDIPAAVGRWARAGELPHYIRAYLGMAVRNHRLILWGDEQRRDRGPTKAHRKKVAVADIEEYFARQDKEANDRDANTCTLDST